MVTLRSDLDARMQYLEIQLEEKEKMVFEYMTIMESQFQWSDQ